VFVKGVQPSDAREVEILDCKAREWGWTAIIPGFGLLADEFAEPWLRLSRVDPDRLAVMFSDTLRLSLRRNLDLAAPQYRIPAGDLARTDQRAYHGCTGVAPELEATRAATRALIDHLVDVRGLDRQEAYALCSVAADLKIHEVVDAPNWMVGAFIPDDIFTT
jgi:acetamidase/formamidase